MVRGTWRGEPPPRPDGTAIYCLPPTLNETGKPCTEVPSRVFHSSLPVAVSKAWKVRSRSPTKVTPPSVVSTPVSHSGCCSKLHFCCIVRTSKAASLPILPLLPGISKKRRSAMVPPEPSVGATTRPFISMQACVSGMTSVLVAGGAAACLHPGLRLRHAPIGQIELGIVSTGDPGVAAGAQHVGELAPAVA